MQCLRVLWEIAQGAERGLPWSIKITLIKVFLLAVRLSLVADGRRVWIKLNFVSDDMTKNTLEVVYSSPAPEFRATADVGVQGVETLYYRKGLFSFAGQRPSGIEVVSARCDAMSKS